MFKSEIKQPNNTYIPFSVPYIAADEIDEVIDTLKSGWITVGPKTKKFEEKFKEYIGCKHAIAVNSCTAALHLGLVAAGVGKNDEVITSTNTFAATVEVIIQCGAKPVLVDIDSDTLNMNPDEVKKVITNKTKAIIPVHYAGQPCNMDEIRSIAEKHNLTIIEDAAHALGAKYKNVNVGNIGDVTTFSFYATKNLTTGEGGMITTNNDDYAEKFKILSLHGISKDAWKRYSAEGSWYYEILYPGYKYNMSDIQAAIGICQLKKFDNYQIQRKKLVDLYNEQLKHLTEIEIPTAKIDVQHAWHLYVIQLNLQLLKISRNEFINKLTENKIGTSVHFIPIHLHPYYKKEYGFKLGDFPNAEQAFQRMISLPLYPQMNNNDICRITECIQEIVSKNRI